jgi:hypothetical protein
MPPTARPGVGGVSETITYAQLKTAQPDRYTNVMSGPHVWVGADYDDVVSHTQLLRRLSGDEDQTRSLSGRAKGMTTPECSGRERGEHDSGIDRVERVPSVIRRAGSDHQQMMRMQLTWVCVCDGDGEEGVVVVCVAVGEDWALEEAVDGLVDCSACAEVADWSGVVAELCDGEAVDEVGDGEVAEALELAVVLESGPLPGGVVGTPVFEIVAGPRGVDVDTAAMAPTGVSPPPAVGRLPRISRPTMMIPATPPVTVALSPRPRRLRERRSLWPSGESAAELSARTSSRSSGPFSARSAGRGTAWELSPI